MKNVPNYCLIDYCQKDGSTCYNCDFNRDYIKYAEYNPIEQKLKRKNPDFCDAGYLCYRTIKICYYCDHNSEYRKYLKSMSDMCRKHCEHCCDFKCVLRRFDNAGIECKYCDKECIHRKVDYYEKSKGYT